MNRGKIGITTTIPVEIVYSAGYIPVDLNNLFISDPDALTLVEEAEIAGYPRNTCAWIKGLYSIVLKHRDIRTVIAVTQGDCSNTHALMETLQLEGVQVIPFAYPFDRDRDLLKLQIEKLMSYFGVKNQQVEPVREKLNKIRRKVWKLDQLTFSENVISGWDNHYYQVSCSDFKGNPERFESELDTFLSGLKGAVLPETEIRLGYAGVPPIIGDLYSYMEEKGARIVFNETQRQFTMPFETQDLVEQYRLYTYPYGIFFRLQDILRQIEKRKIDGLVHYAQGFCFRQIEDLIMRKKINIPVLTLEGDKPNHLDARTRTRIDAFLEMISRSK
ncbi:MAG: 2-hydroxyglutaryl-CoA dehydratase D-component [Desulfotomaculum sp. 46_296]|nr:MAG: 2-hydroxyglutaryl-CoA dehydratase D-component [Desulfotomaculum sp. 46_296]HAU32506.1 2-hydroxyglutaryl-CoA dehydratase [Desulfotomaculum sp.]